MKTRPVSARLILAPVFLLLASRAGHLAAQMPSIGSSSPWVIAPYFFPRGALIAFVEGDPNKNEPFRVDLAFPRGYRMQPHYHANAIHVQVKQGGLKVGVGGRLDLKKTQAVAPGDTATVPAGAHYFYAATTETIITVTSIGPFTLNYVDPANDPSRRSAFGP